MEARRLDARGLADITRLFSSSIADLLDDYFESTDCGRARSRGHRDLGRAAFAWHRVPDGAPPDRRRRRRRARLVGVPGGGMGGLTAAIAKAARSFGAESVPGPGRPHPTSRRPGHRRGARAAARSSPPRSWSTTGIRRSRFCACSSAASCRRTLSATSSGGTPVGNGQGQPRRRPPPRIRRQAAVSTPRSTAARSSLPARSTRSRRRSRTPSPAGRRPAVRRHLHPLGVRLVARPRRPPRRLDVHASGSPSSGPGTPMTPSSTPTPTGWSTPSTRSPPGSRARSFTATVIGPHDDGARTGWSAGTSSTASCRPISCSILRPAAGYADFRTPIGGLYQAGSATHGGGGVTGIPAMQAARQIAHDEKAARWRRKSRG